MARTFAPALLISLIAAAWMSASLPAQTAARPDTQVPTAATPVPQIPPPRFPPGISLETGLSEDDAVALALWNNAAFQADLALLGVARADLIDAGLLRNPTLQMLLPVGYRQFEMLLNLPVEVFWQRPRRVAAAKIEFERAAQGLEQNGLDLIREVRLAFSDLILAKERSRLIGEAVRLRAQIVSLTEARLRAGDISELETNAARVELSTTEALADRASREAAQAHDRLRLMIGLEGIQTAFDFRPGKPEANPPGPATGPESLALDPLLADAFAHRPDLRGAALAIEAAAKKAKWERSRLLAFAGLLSIKQGAGLDFSPRGGLLVELPVFNRNQGAISRADAEVERAGRQYLAVHQRIAQEVSTALAQLQQASAGLEAYRARILPQTVEGVNLSEKAYRSGDESYLFALQAVRQLTDAQIREAELSHQLRSARAQLDRSIGRKRNAN